MTQKSGYKPRYLKRLNRAARSSVAQSLVSDETAQKVDKQIDVFIENAQKNVSGPLVRKAKAYPRFAIGASTFSKKVAAGELPQPAYKSGSITGYKEIELDMMLAAQTLATRNGFMLDAKAFVAALSAPVNASEEVSA
ncbi:hypothetical protein CY652_15785 [Burkholderia sp. WAC0059]|uniref:hypothetical protein n=1 Tax=Burkholderia sp. WAC0059 TaxID=2066022 RepID=UPI000C7EC9BA|nr:hypothetical protein [Burkholderia sp. WAC0059]PLZ01569.1 hypothetical protein CY652_15785 [Burkholderia sp. WAC0059]